MSSRSAQDELRDITQSLRSLPLAVDFDSVPSALNASTVATPAAFTASSVGASPYQNLLNTSGAVLSSSQYYHSLTGSASATSFDSSSHINMSLNASTIGHTSHPVFVPSAVSGIPSAVKSHTSAVSDALDMSDDDALFAASLRSTSSKAVLSALRALQAKIHRLEADKAELKAEVDRLNNKVSQQHNELTIVHSQLTDRQSVVILERDEVKRALAVAQTETEVARESIRRADTDRASLQQLLMATQESTMSLQMDLQRRSQEKHDFEHQMSAMQAELSSARADLATANAAKTATEESNAKLEEYLRNVLIINEQLVRKFTQRSESDRGVSVPVSTHPSGLLSAADAAAAVASMQPRKSVSASNSNSTAPAPAAHAASLQAHAAIKKSSRPVTAPTKNSTARSQTESSKPAPLHKQVHQILGNVPFVAGGQTARTFHLPSNVQKVMRRAPSVSHSHSCPACDSESDRKHDVKQDEAGATPVMAWPHDESVGKAKETGPFEASLRSQSAERTSKHRTSLGKETRSTSTERLTQPLGMAPGGHVHPHSRIVDDETLQNLRTVMSTLEQEVQELEKEYNAALHSAHESVVQLNGNTALSPKLALLIEQLEGKGQQLFLLRRYEEDVQHGRHLLDNISTLHSAESKRNYERKIQSLRLIGDLRKLMQ